MNRPVQPDCPICVIRKACPPKRAVIGTKFCSAHNREMKKKEVGIQRLRENENATRLMCYEDQVRGIIISREEDVVKCMQESAKKAEEFSTKEDEIAQNLSDAVDEIVENARTETANLCDLINKMKEMRSTSPTKRPRIDPEPAFVSPAGPVPAPATFQFGSVPPSPSAAIDQIILQDSMLENEKLLAQMEEMKATNQNLTNAYNQVSNENMNAKAHIIKVEQNFWLQDNLLKQIFSIMEQAPPNIGGFVINHLEEINSKRSSENPLLVDYLKGLKQNHDAKLKTNVDQ